MTVGSSKNQLFIEFIKITAAELRHKDEHCWDECNKIQGRCNWCGSKGYCCRKNWKAGNGCDGSFGGNNHHTCTLKPGIIYDHTYNL